MKIFLKIILIPITSIMVLFGSLTFKSKAADIPVVPGGFDFSFLDSAIASHFLPYAMAEKGFTTNDKIYTFDRYVEYCNENGIPISNEEYEKYSVLLNGVDAYEFKDFAVNNPQQIYSSFNISDNGNADLTLLSATYDIIKTTFENGYIISLFDKITGKLANPNSYAFVQTSLLDDSFISENFTFSDEPFLYTKSYSVTINYSGGSYTDTYYSDAPFLIIPYADGTHFCQVQFNEFSSVPIYRLSSIDGSINKQVLNVSGSYPGLRYRTGNGVTSFTSSLNYSQSITAVALAYSLIGTNLNSVLNTIVTVDDVLDSYNMDALIDLSGTSGAFAPDITGKLIGANALTNAMDVLGDTASVPVVSPYPLDFVATLEEILEGLNEITTDLPDNPPPVPEFPIPWPDGLPVPPFIGGFFDSFNGMDIFEPIFHIVPNQAQGNALYQVWLLIPTIAFIIVIVYIAINVF